MKFTLQPRLLKQNLPNCQPSSKTKVYFEFCFQGGQYQSAEQAVCEVPADSENRIIILRLTSA